MTSRPAGCGRPGPGRPVPQGLPPPSRYGVGAHAAIGPASQRPAHPRPPARRDGEAGARGRPPRIRSPCPRARAGPATATRSRRPRSHASRQARTTTLAVAARPGVSAHRERTPAGPRGHPGRRGCPGPRRDGRRVSGARCCVRQISRSRRNARERRAAVTALSVRDWQEEGSGGVDRQRSTPLRLIPASRQERSRIGRAIAWP